MWILEPESLSGDVLPPLLSADEFSAGTGGRVPASDPRLGALLAGASAAIRNYCGWHIAPAIEDDYVLDFGGGGLIVLPSLFVRSVEALTVGGVAVDVGDLEWSHNGEIRLLARSRPAFRSVGVTIQHGFDLAAVADLGQVVQQVVGNAISSPLGATREQAGAVSVSWAATAPGVSGGISLLERDYAVIDRYRLPRGA